jgi:hypothetical protein
MTSHPRFHTDEDDISVRGYPQQLRWIAPGLLAGFLGLWVSGVARGMSLPAALFPGSAMRAGHGSVTG